MRGRWRSIGHIKKAAIPKATRLVEMTPTPFDPENERMMNMLMNLIGKYLSENTKSKVSAVLKVYGDELDIVKMIHHEFNECNFTIDDGDKKTIKEIALYYL